MYLLGISAQSSEIIAKIIKAYRFRKYIWLKTIRSWDIPAFNVGYRFLKAL